MVFIMCVLPKKPYNSPFIIHHSQFTIHNSQFTIILWLCLLFWSNVTYAQFSINYAHTRLVDEVYLLSAELNCELSDVAIEALQNGISLVIVLTVTVKRERRFLWNQKIATIEQRYELKYHALSRQYILKYPNTGIQENFLTLNAILARLGNLKDFPLLNKHLITHKNGTYWVNLQIYLDIESLPVPLRPIAYLSSQWRLSSNWYLCPLQTPR